MNIFKKLTFVCTLFLAFGVAIPSFALTATVDVDRILFEYSKSKAAAEQFKAQEDNLQAMIMEAQKKLKTTSSPVEKKNIEATYEKKIKAQAEKYRMEQVKKLQEIEKDVMLAIEKVNNGKYDVILKKGATVFCQNDITEDVLKRLNNKQYRYICKI